MLHIHVRKEDITVDKLKSNGFLHDQLLFGKYRVEEQIGSGGFSRVYRCSHVTMGISVAVKQMEISNRTQSVIQNESEILKILKHPGIPTLYDIQKDENYYYLIEEFFEGEVLSSYIQGRNLDLENIGKIMISLLEILVYLHSLPVPVLYLDLQPDNIIIRNGEAVLIDFGNAVKKGGQYLQNYFHGTLGYAAPEQYYGEAAEQSDIYAAGAILYFLFYKKTPGGTETELPEQTKISPLLKEWMQRAMKHRKEERYQTVEEMKQAAETLFRKQTGSKEISLTITFAGSIPRIGTTHISLAFAEYLGKQGLQVFYQEDNDSGTIQSILDAYQLKTSCGLIQFPHFQAFPYYNHMIQEPQIPYNIKIRDFGVLTEEKKEEYEKSDVSILVLGIKPWEQKRIELQQKAEQQIWLYNFSDSKEYRKILKNPEQKNCFRVPMFLDYQKPDETAERFFSQLYQSISGKKQQRERWCFWKKWTGKRRKPEKQ